VPRRLPILVLAAACAPQVVAAAEPATLDVPTGIRLLVVAPHPDDEVLGAAGLIQRVHREQGRVEVLYLTSGDGYLEGVETTTGKVKPQPHDFVAYGETRLHESANALHAILLPPRAATFLGFPDGGLASLLGTYWSGQKPFISPYTGDSRTPYREATDPGSEYSGVALEREVTLAVARFHPDWIAVTGPWDIHPDHCSAYRFTMRALERRKKGDAGPSTLLVYTIHRPDWPGSASERPLTPPPGVTLHAGSWRSLELRTAELERKGAALQQYVTQMDIMAVLFRAFVRSNELFAVVSPVASEPPSPCVVR
jgi:LmbE family N-acetylglucosaminyl deacetylase